MKPSGIPPHVELYKQLEKRHHAIDALSGMLEQQMKKALEEIPVAASNLTREVLREQIKSLLGEAGFEVSKPPIAATASQLHSCFSWGGKVYQLPQDFEFPSIDSLGAWRLWWFGDARRGYPPYRTISSNDLDTAKKKATLSDWAVMMRHITNAIEAQMNEPLSEIRDEAHAVEMFHMGYDTLKLKSSKGKRRNNEIKLTTALRLIREAEGRRTRSIPFKPRKRQASESRSESQQDAEGL